MLPSIAKITQSLESLRAGRWLVGTGATVLVVMGCLLAMRCGRAVEQEAQ
jgi:hypothetical protein